VPGSYISLNFPETFPSIAYEAVRGNRRAVSRKLSLVWKKKEIQGKKDAARRTIVARARAHALCEYVIHGSPSKGRLIRITYCHNFHLKSYRPFTFAIDLVSFPSFLLISFSTTRRHDAILFYLLRRYLKSASILRRVSSQASLLVVREEQLKISLA